MKRVNGAIAADLEQLAESTQRLLTELEHLELEFFRGDESDSDGKQRWETALDLAKDDLHEGIEYALLTLEVRLTVYADALGLPDTKRLIDSWKQRWPRARWKTTRHWSTSEADGVESPAYTELRPILDCFLVLTRPEKAPPPDLVARRDRARLEHALRSLAKLCRERDVVPQREFDVQKVMRSHLEGVFDDYVTKPSIDKPLVHFEPDGGIPSLKAAIECKFVSTESEVKEAVHGLTEDLSGYAGSNQWTEFYSVVYMTEAFATEGQFRTALGKSGHAGGWTTILVTGAGSRKPRERQRERSTVGEAPTSGSTEGS
jgi:hypothetical protein